MVEPDPISRRKPWLSTTSILIVLAAIPLLALAVAAFVLRTGNDDQADEATVVIEMPPEKAKSDDSQIAQAAVSGDEKEPPPAAPVKPPEADKTESAAPPMAPLVAATEKAPPEPSVPAAAPPAPAPSPDPPEPPKPWQAVLDSVGDPPGFADVAFLPFESGFAGFDHNDLPKWLAKTEDAGLRHGQIATQRGRAGTIEGIAKLLSPWPDDGVLRLELDNFNRLKIHFFSGLSGATLVYYEDQGYRWAAYTTTREAGQSTPTSWAITATDDGRCQRTGMKFGGPLELRCRGGEIMLSRGDVVLLAAPFTGPPTEVFFEGRATVHGIALARTHDAPPYPPTNPITRDIERPADLKWALAPSAPTDAPQMELLANGAVRLAGSKLKKRFAYFTELPQLGMHEVVVELNDLTPGAGIYLARGDKEASEVLRFHRDQKSGQLAAKVRGADDAWEDAFADPNDKPSPLVQPHCWVKLLYGCGNLRWWLSSDGVHWAQVEPARDKVQPGITGIGIQLAANCPDAGLTVNRLSLRKLAGLTSLVDADLLEKATDATDAKSLGDWRAEVVAKKPAEIAEAEWLRACTIRTLGATARRELAYPLLAALLDDTAQRTLPLAQQIAAVNDGVLLALDLRDRGAMTTGLLSRYPRLGSASAAQSNLPAWSDVRAAYFAAPAVTSQQTPANLDRALRYELIQLAYQKDSRATAEFLKRLQFFHLDRDRPLVDWLEAIAQRDTAGRTANDSVARTKDAWRPLLVEELSKDAYNALTELKALLESEAWDDAANYVARLKPQTAPGVAPYVNDKALLVSLPVAVQLLLDDYPQLRQALDEKLAPLARLRVAEAIRAGDAAAISLATVQFAGLPAAAEAHRWLGDQALVAGWFAKAIEEYQLALGGATENENEIAPRLRLAAAMLGRDAGKAATASVQFGDVTMSAAEFESLVAEMRERAKKTGTAAGAEAMPVVVPAPSGFESHVRSRLDGPAGERPQEEVGRRTKEQRVAWVDRQLATAVSGDVLYAANRFQVAAYDLSTGERKWQSQAPPGTMQRAQEWSLVPMRPLVVGDRILVRLLYSASSLLVCFDKANGKLLWTAENREREFLVSDPLLIENQLVVLAIAPEPDQQGLLRCYAFDPQTGEIHKQRDLVRLRSTWSSRAVCQVAPYGGGLVACLGGVTLAIDRDAKVLWVRSHTTVPAEEDPRWLLQSFQPPLISGQLMYVAQPGVRTVECLSPATGATLWSNASPEVIGVVGLVGNSIIVRTEAGFRAWRAGDGSRAWYYAVSSDDPQSVYDFQLLDSKHLLIASRERDAEKSDRYVVRLTWLNTTTGKSSGTTSLTNLAGDDPRLGPLMTHGKRLFTFFGNGPNETTRDFVELVPRGSAEQPNAPDAWQTRR